MKFRKTFDLSATNVEIDNYIKSILKGPKVDPDDAGNDEPNAEHLERRESLLKEQHACDTCTIIMHSHAPIRATRPGRGEIKGRRAEGGTLS